MSGARSAGGMRFKVGRKPVRDTTIPTAAEVREIQRNCVDRAGGSRDFNRNIKWFSEYERLLADPKAWTPERANTVLQMTATLLRESAPKRTKQKQFSTIFYCLAIIAKGHGISPRGIVSIEPLGFGIEQKGVKKGRKP